MEAAVIMPVSVVGWHLPHGYPFAIILTAYTGVAKAMKERVMTKLINRTKDRDLCFKLFSHYPKKALAIIRIYYFRCKTR